MIVRTIGGYDVVGHPKWDASVEFRVYHTGENTPVFDLQRRWYWTGWPDRPWWMRALGLGSMEKALARATAFATERAERDARNEKGRARARLALKALKAGGTA